MKDKKKAEEIAVMRLQLITPMLDPSLDSAKAKKLRQEACEKSGLSDRTIRRYLQRYRQEGFAGLKPKGKGQRRTATISADILDQAILLRREVPSRSVAQIIQILEWEGRIKPGELKRSTLQEKLTANGYSARHMRMYAGGGLAARRYQVKSRNQMWQSDIKYGPYLPIGPNGSLKQTYLVVFIDDATRFVLHGAFYPTLDQVIVQDAFRQAIGKYGLPDTVYFDNGKQYKTKWMKRACAKLGIRLLFTKPYAPEAKGKVERFNRRVDTFLNEVRLDKPQTLDHLNTLFGVWLDACYQTQSHSALKNNMSPEVAFRSDTKSLKYLDLAEVAQAFLHLVTRKVDKSGCISFQGEKYEVGMLFIGCQVDVVYDPSNTNELTIEHEGHPSFTAKKLKIGPHTGKRPKLPKHLTPIEADHSRLLEAAKDQQTTKQKRMVQAVSYRSLTKSGV